MHNALSIVNKNNAKCIFAFMQNASMTPDDLKRIRAERLREAREARFPTVQEGWEHVRKYVDVALTSYTQHENGTRGIPKDKAPFYAEAFGIDVKHLMYKEHSSSVVTPIDRMVPVLGDVQAGIWIETHDGEPVEYLPYYDPQFDLAQLFALRVRGPSMNKIYPDGTIVVCVRSIDGGVFNRDIVVVRRVDPFGKAETTLKQIVQKDGKIEFWPRSDDPRYQSPFTPPPRSEHDAGGFEIMGRVVASYTKATPGSGEPIDFF